MQGQGDDKGMNINYEELLEAKKKQDVLIIDIRENSEIEETGRLPGSIHIPSMHNILYCSISRKSRYIRFNEG